MGVWRGLGGGRGTPVYNSTAWRELEHGGVLNTSAMAEAYLAKVTTRS